MKYEGKMAFRILRASWGDWGLKCKGNDGLWLSLGQSKAMFTQGGCHEKGRPEAGADAWTGNDRTKSGADWI